MIIKNEQVLRAPNSAEITLTLTMEVGVNWREQHPAVQFLHGASNKIGHILNEDPKSWQPQVAY